MAAAADVLMVGAPGVGKAVLLRGLQAQRCADHSQDPSMHSLSLSTKYYDADLVLQCHELGSGPAAAATAAAFDQLQALLLVVDASKQSSLDAAMRFHESLGDAEIDIQLLVANNMGSLLPPAGQVQDSDSSRICSIQRPAWLQDAREWCCAHGFEYIEAAAGRPGVDAALHEDGEPQGVARVLAALQAHMWPNMRPKQQQQQQQSRRGQPADRPQHAAAVAAGSSSTTQNGAVRVQSSSSGAKDQGTAAAAPSEPQQQQQQQQQEQQGQPIQQVGTCGADAVPTPKPPQPTSTSAAAAAAAAGDTAAAAAGKGRATQQQQSQSEQAAVAAAAATAAGLDDDPFLGAEPDDFEQLMRQVVGARARLAALPDAERRAAAADLALKLSSMMGLGDDSDNGSEDVTAADDRRQ